MLEVKLDGAIIKSYQYREGYIYPGAGYSGTNEGDFDYEQQTLGFGDTAYTKKTIYNGNGLPLIKQEKTGNGSFASIVEAQYNADGRLLSITDYTNGISPTQEQVMTPTYNNDGSVKKMVYTGARIGSIENEVMSNGEVRKEITFNNKTRNYRSWHEYGNEERKISYIQYGLGGNSDAKVRYQSDQLGRPKEKNFCNSNGTFAGTSVYEYALKGSDTTNLVSDIYHINNNNCFTESYTYWGNNNIKTYTDIQGKQHSYEYDAAGRLTRENNQALDFTKIYSYNGGNISTIKEYKYTTAHNLTGGTTYTYNYMGVQKTQTQGD